jgi:hypothetical protein
LPDITRLCTGHCPTKPNPQATRALPDKPNASTNQGTALANLSNETTEMLAKGDEQMPEGPGVMLTEESVKD